MCRKPIRGDIASGVMENGVGGLNIDGCRIGVVDSKYQANCSGDRGHSDNRKRDMEFKMGCGTASEVGRFPANIIHEDCDSVIFAFDKAGVLTSGSVKPGTIRKAEGVFNAQRTENKLTAFDDSGSAARFFWSFE